MTAYLGISVSCTCMALVRGHQRIVRTTQGNCRDRTITYELYITEMSEVQTGLYVHSFQCLIWSRGAWSSGHCATVQSTF